MKYFETYFRKSSTRKSSKKLDNQREEILIHCDCSIFEWLISFMENPNEVAKLDLSMVLPVLIASDFLMMERAISFCISYISKNIHDLFHHASISLSCLKESLLTRIACELKPKDLMMISRSTYDDGGESMCVLELMYKSKIDQEFCDERSKNNITFNDDSKMNRRPNAKIKCCVKCGRIYINNTENNMTLSQKSCRASKFYVGYRGELSGQSCIPDTSFSLFSSLKLLRNKFTSWSKVYWQLKRIVTNSMIYSMIQSQTKANWLKNRTEKFICNSLSYERQCPTEPYFGKGSCTSIWGVHSCCGKVVLKFNPWDFDSGCTIIADSEMIENVEDAQLAQQIYLRDLIFESLGECDNRTFIELDDINEKYHQRENNLNPTLRPSSRNSRFESQPASEDLKSNNQYEYFSSREFLFNIPSSQNDTHKAIGESSWLSAFLLKGSCVGNNHQRLHDENHMVTLSVFKSNDEGYLKRDNASTFSKVFCTLEENQRNELQALRDSKLDGVRKLSWMKHLRMEIDTKRTNTLIRTLIHLRKKSEMNE